MPVGTQRATSINANRTNESAYLDVFQVAYNIPIDIFTGDSIMQRLGFALGVLFLLPSLLSAQAAKDRVELGQRLQALERTLAKTTDLDLRAKTLTEMKSLTFTFFSGQLGKAARMLDEARLTLEGTEDRDAKLWAASLSIQPATHLLDRSTDSLAVLVKSYYAVNVEAPKPVQLRVELFADGSPKALAKHAMPLAKVPTELRLPVVDVPAGDYRLRVEIVAKNRLLLRREQTIARAESVHDRLAKLQQALDAMPKADTVRQGTLRHLLELLTTMSKGDPLEMDYPAHRLLSEAEALANEKPPVDPKKPGQHWLYLPTRRGSIIRVQAPTAAKTGKPMPLVIALHGAGGSENFFFEAYGNGLIAELCEKRGWLLVAPRNGLSTDIVEQIVKLYPVDTKRIFLVGHSMGAAQAVSEAVRLPKAYAGVAALGGSGFVRSSEGLASLPFFVGVGTEDFALSGARALSRSLEQVGVRDVRLKKYEGVEHLTVVQIALPDVFAFFDELAKTND